MTETFRKSHPLARVGILEISGVDNTLPWRRFRSFPLVNANFAAELETLVLTAGHDAAKLRQPVLMVMRDAGGVSCSIIYGHSCASRWD